MISIEFLGTPVADFKPELTGKVITFNNEVDAVDDDKHLLLHQFDQELSRAFQESEEGRSWTYGISTIEYCSHLPAFITNQNIGKITTVNHADSDWTVEANFWTPLAFGMGVTSKNIQMFENASVDGKVGTGLSEHLDYQCLLSLVGCAI